MIVRLLVKYNIKETQNFALMTLWEENPPRAVRFTPQKASGAEGLYMLWRDRDFSLFSSVRGCGMKTTRQRNWPRGWVSKYPYTQGYIHITGKNIRMLNLFR